MANILILGAGYGGISTSAKLSKASVPFTLVNKHSYYYFTTLLHEFAGGRNGDDPYRVEISDVVKGTSSKIVKDEVLKLIPSEKKVICQSGEYTYDYLVFALGNAPEYFGIDGLKEHSMVLRSLESAKKIREHIEKALASYEEDKDESKLRIIVGGAGLTGIEFLGELSEWIPVLSKKYNFPQEKVQLINLEAAPSVLPMLDKNLQEAVIERLTKNGVSVRTNEKIVKVEENVVELASGERINAKTIIWTGGVRANPLLMEAGFETDGRGRAKVNEFLQSVNFPEVFIIGDSACFIGADGRPLPPTAQAAGQMGDCVAKNIINLLSSKSLVPFKFNYLGTLASVGREYGVGNVKGVNLKGFLASSMKEGSKLKWLFTLGGMSMIGKKVGQFFSDRNF